MTDESGRAESPVLPVQMWLRLKKVFTSRCCWAGQMTKHSFVSLSNIRYWLLICSLGCSSSVLLCMCLNETTILHEEMKPQVNNSVVITEVRVILLKGTSAGCILLHAGGSFSCTVATLPPCCPQCICCFMSCHAFCNHILDRSLLYYFFLPVGVQRFAPGAGLLCRKLMSTNSTSCHSLCSWQLHALKPPLLLPDSFLFFPPLLLNI